MKLLWFILLLWGLSFSTFSADLPARIDISYLIKTGIGSGKLDETIKIKRENGLYSYSITSKAEATGVMKLIKPGSILRDSQGIITKLGLQPDLFSDQRSKKKTSVAIFDWENNLLPLQFEGKKEQESLPVGTLDRLSLSYNFMFSPLSMKFLDIYVTDGSSLRQVRYVVGKELLETPIGKLETIVLTMQRNKNEKQKRKIWFATAHHMLPVRIVSTEEDGLQIEKIVTNIDLSYSAKR
jgi:hypothetical protein